MAEKVIQVMISMPESYHPRLIKEAKENGRTVSGQIRYWLDRSDKIKMRKIFDRAMGTTEK
jgi:hypothetical protein